MKYKVPLFIEREARIIPGLTFKQLGYLLGFGIAGIIFWVKLPGFLKYIVSPLFFFFGFVLAFFKLEGLPTSKLLIALFEYLTGGKIFIWKKEKEAIKLYEKKLPFFKKARKEEIEQKREIFEEELFQKTESKIAKTKLKLEMKTK